ncbi:MAG: HU family DNA-binding protein [bacterium]
MNKADIIEELRKVVSTQTEAKQACEKVFQTMRESLQKGDKVVISGFGSFNVKIRKARKARNISTGETIDVPATRRIKFVGSKHLL